METWFQFCHLDNSEKSEKKWKNMEKTCGTFQLCRPIERCFKTSLNFFLTGAFQRSSEMLFCEA